MYLSREEQISIIEGAPDISAEDLALPADRERLRGHFSVPAENHGGKWSELWDRGDFLPWDRGTPNPALVDLLAQWEDHGFFTAQDALKTRRRALVPGCGRGYDVHLLSTYGYDSYGLDISGSAVKEASNWVVGKLEEEKKLNPEHELSGWGQAHMVEGDFFHYDWYGERGVQPKGGFDLIYDYTFLCALPPALRLQWGARMAELIAPQHGILVCIEFPLYKSAESGGPPWGLTSQIYDELLRDAFEKVLHRMPERTHAVGKGTDWVSVWRRKSG